MDPTVMIATSNSTAITFYPTRTTRGNLIRRNHPGLRRQHKNQKRNRWRAAATKVGQRFQPVGAQGRKREREKVSGCVGCVGEVSLIASKAEIGKAESRNLEIS